MLFFLIITNDFLVKKYQFKNNDQINDYYS